MSKREKLLLQIMVCVAVVGGLAVYLLLPAIKKNIRLKEEVLETEATAEEMEMVINTDGIIEGYEKAVTKADETYDFFYGDIKSFKVDELVNELVVKNNLKINSISIGDYTDRSDDELYIVKEDGEEEEETEKESLLIGRDVSVSIEGAYQDVLSFIDDLNAKSECIRINNASYTKNVRNIDGQIDEGENYLNSVNINFTIYAIKKYEPKEVALDE